MAEELPDNAPPITGKLGPGRRRDLEFSGILPVESGIVKGAVLGGALAVP